MSAWSSTTRILCMLARSGRADRFRSQRQFHDEAGARGLVFLHADGAVMIFNDVDHNGQTPPGAAFLGGKVRQEKPFFQLGGNSRAGVGDVDFNRVTSGNQSSGNLNLAK